MKQQTKLIFGILAFALVIAGAFFTYRHLGSNSIIDDHRPNPNAINEQAPDFTVIDEDGQVVRLSDLRGNPVVLNFWASWCPPCRAEMPEFDQVWSELGGEMRFMMVNLTDGRRETTQIASDYIKGQGFAFPVYYDTQNEASAAYGVSTIPTTLFIDRDGNIVRRVLGQMNEATLRSNIELIH